MRLYDSDKKEIEKMIEERLTAFPEIMAMKTNQLAIVVVAILLAIIMFFSTLIFCSKEKTKRIQIEKYGEQITVEDKE